MKKYVVKFVSEATDKNEKFKGDKHVCYYGIRNSVETNADNLKGFAKWYGYSTKAAAIGGFKKCMRVAEWESERGYWKDSCELLEIEIEE